MASPRLAASSVILLCIVGSSAAQNDEPGAAPQTCSVASRAIPLRELREASGIAMSSRAPGVFWAHNDSGMPVLVALEGSGAVRGRVQITGARVEDWEDVSVGPCGAGTCVYVADIGDNDRIRPNITVYRAPEPAPGDRATARADVLEAVYPDGPHDAEALFVTGPDDIFIVTKTAEERTALYRFPKPLRPGTRARLERVTHVPVDRVTDADASPDGAWVVLRNHDELFLYATRDLLSGSGMPRRVSLKALKEPQGEGVTFGPNGTIHLVGEGNPGTLASLRCTLR
jgi:hypothetical protein